MRPAAAIVIGCLLVSFATKRAEACTPVVGPIASLGVSASQPSPGSHREDKPVAAPRTWQALYNEAATGWRLTRERRHELYAEARRLHCQSPDRAQPTDAPLGCGTGPRFYCGEQPKLKKCSVERGAILQGKDLTMTARIVPAFDSGKPAGVKVFSLRPDSVLSQLGLENGDMVLSVNGRETKSEADLLRALRSIQQKGPIQLVAERDFEDIRWSCEVR